MKKVNVVNLQYEWPEKTYENYGILAYHVAVINQMENGDEINLLGFVITRKSDSFYYGCHESDIGDTRYPGSVYPQRYLGNVYGATEWYAANFVENLLK